jgi:hypothetical protein
LSKNSPFSFLVLPFLVIMAGWPAIGLSANETLFPAGVIAAIVIAAFIAAAVAAFATPQIAFAAAIAFIDIILIVYLDLIIKVGFL